MATEWDRQHNAMFVLKQRYLRKDDNGRIIETPDQMFRRVAKAVASSDKRYNGDASKSEDSFYNLMVQRKFLPNSPTLMNAGTEIGQLSACFVLAVGDSLSEIFDAVKYAALIQQSGGGTGFSFSNIRPAGDMVRSTRGIASGPISFMRIFDVATDAIKQGGRRRGANMGVLHVSHPDIMDFILAKSKPGVLTNFNLSVAVSDKFMNAAITGKKYDLINPRNGKVVKSLNAKDVFNTIITSAWRTGDPGLIFIDEINRKNPTAKLGEITATNPCGEQPLHPYESCNLGSINLSKFVSGKKVLWADLKETVKIGVHFLDNVIDVNKYPMPEIEKMTKSNRRIGLGVMGWAEMLIKLGIPYDSKKALQLAEHLMKFISDEARKASQELGKKRGNFLNFSISKWKTKYKYMRNATCTTIAPTGTISIIAQCSSGIEPLFAVCFMREVLEGKHLLEINPVFEEIAKKRKFYSEKLMHWIAKHGGVQKLEEVPKDIKALFKTALEIPLEWHIYHQAAFQKYTDNAVSKTINLPHDATINDVRKAYLLSYKAKCKGITIYRYGSKPKQVLYLGEIGEPVKEIRVAAESEFAGGCPGTTCPY